jgi:CheY-like chemotaxis protein
MDGVSILVVDDERPILTLISRALEGGGHRVRTAGSGQEALALREALNTPIDLLITDMVMPEMDGCGWPKRSSASFRACACCSSPASAT